MLFRLWRSRSVLLTVIGCFVLLLTISFGVRVLAQNNYTLPERPNTVTAQAPNLGRHFQELGLEGSILIYDLNKNRTYEHNPQRNATAMLPGSTFKIFNAMVALETGVIPDDVAVFTWDGIQRPIEEWNHDTNLRQAFKDSTVWFYQVLARRAGHKRMQEFIDQVGYGNRQIGNTEDIDRFWLQGPLEITPKAQIQFLQRLYRNNLPFSQRTMDLVKDIMVREQTPEYTLRGKTGWLDSTKPELGWFVGYLEQNKNVYFFATTIDMRKPSDAPLRIEITRRSLKDLGLL
ncbi:MULTISPECIES: class D beta-lactamase [Fischerella]|uniref:beta-lactamase n=1 Tax=Fischerella muscicola CCMEE 5323 TaxID=2019572 RepID=A0A2N6K7X2_FISMU|nr:MULTISPECIES: class D beta-lactamase [Fischerella]MBD2434216.1 class D beta-lactamase [Fischerella sp. FACHB-380]PLZ93229.1 class D beta-lactamase [Fischerella muscicola CCMEE 5323]